MPRLILMTPGGGTKQFALGDADTTLGRADGNTIVLDSERVSRRHALIRQDGPFCAIDDLASRNGVFVNGVRVNQTQVLGHGDEIEIGGRKLRFFASSQEYSQVDALRLMTVPGLLIDLDKPAAPGRASS